MRVAALLFLIMMGMGWSACAQPDFYLKGQYGFTRADTLRGSLRPERTCFDVTFYGLNIRVDPQTRTLSGYVDIDFQVVTPTTRLQLDLDRRMSIEQIQLDGARKLAWQREADAVFVHTPLLHPDTHHRLRVWYGGQPRKAPWPPWQGGFVWEKDRNGKPWIGVACEGDGASLWWPNKDHLSDEPDSAAINVEIPQGVVCVANGQFRGVDTLNSGWYRYHWFVSYPINNYNITVNIGDYVHFRDWWVADDGDTLALDYYVLSYNEEKAKKHFQQVQGVLSCFERYFGKYPFWRDGYALVETPYLGMEHQGAIAYGNKFKKGYLGRGIPEHMDWDYIIVHETGHEWFGNCLSVADLAEMWIHESFTTYMESLYVECRYGYSEAVNYLMSQRHRISNQEPILGPMGVNWEDWRGSDHYFKGAWLLHTLRHAIGNDELWFDLLKRFYLTYACGIVQTADFVQFVNEATGHDWSAVFDQYLRWTRIPVLQYRIEQNPNGAFWAYRWQADVPAFDMPIFVEIDGKRRQIIPQVGRWQHLPVVQPDEVRVPIELFLIELEALP